MTNIFFTSDHHFGHTNIIKYCDRPFADSQEMDEHLISVWNNTVKKGDIVHHLGDFAITGYSKQHVPVVDALLDRLNGTKTLHIGNHDAAPVQLSTKWSSIKRLSHLNVDKQRIILCHYALRTWQFKNQGSWMLYGHSHGNLPLVPGELSCDVGVDSTLGKAFNMGPIPFEYLRDEYFAEGYEPTEQQKKLG